MTKKNVLFEEAERLYVVEQMHMTKIASKLKLNYKTILAWREEGDWQEKRFELIRAKQLFHQDLYVFSRKLMHEIEESMQNGIEPSQSKMLTFTRSLSLLLKVKDYEDKVSKKDPKPKGTVITEDIIKVMEEALGIKSQNDINNEGNEENESEY